MKYRLGEIAEITMGQSPKSQYYNNTGDGIPFLQGNRTFGFKKPIFDTYTTHITKTAKAGDVIMSVRAPVGDLNITPKDICIGRGVCSLRMKNGNQEFLYYMMKYYVSRLLKRESGTVFGSVNRRDIETLEVDIPEDENVQKKIARYLSMIDEKIELNNRINNNLLQQLHVLYLRLFCNSAMDTPLGDVVATTSGGTPSRKHDEYYSDSSICWVKSKELLGNYIHETEEHINDLAIKKSSAKLLPEHSVLIAMYGATVGAYGVICKPMTCNQAVCALLCNENYPYTYLFQIAYESQQKFINLAVGSAQQNISQVLIKQLNLHSDLNIIQKFHDLALPMHQRIEFLQAENIRLSDLRDNLLPKLMSGELDVSNVEI